MMTYQYFTKAELIAALEAMPRSTAPTVRDLAFARWQRNCRDHDRARIKLQQLLNELDFAQRDEYAKQFNAATDIEEKRRLMALIEPFHKAFQRYIDGNEALRKAEKENQALYEQMGEQC